MRPATTPLPDDGTPHLSLTQSAYRRLRRDILDNELPPGRRMLEQEVADYLQMSRTPVREALIRLAEEGFVDVRPRHGMVVLPISVADMDEIYTVLTSLEATAAELAAERGIDAAAGQAIDRVLAEMDRALAERDLKAWGRADGEFHRLLVQCAGNTRIIGLVAGMWDQAHRARMATLSRRPLPIASNADHRDLVDAIRSGDGERARQIHTAHRKRAGELLIRLLTEMGLDEV